MALSGLFWRFLRGKPCKVRVAPYDVRLFADPKAKRDNKNDDTVVQPDLVVICDEEKRAEEGCRGNPDLVVEIFSPSTKFRDMTLKFYHYIVAGVREYWVIDPDAKTLSVYKLATSENGNYYAEPVVYDESASAPVGIFQGELTITLTDVFGG
jgi:Uma2 family endonuclease